MRAGLSLPAQPYFDFDRNNIGADETRAPDRRGHFEKGGRRSDEAQE
jgi:hypothetical protein